MKNAKFSLAIVLLFGIIGGAFAFKANRQLRVFYAYTVTFVAGNMVGACLIQTMLLYQTSPAGPIRITVSDQAVISVTTCTVRVAPNA
jgi:hypothetical protein